VSASADQQGLDDAARAAALWADAALAVELNAIDPVGLGGVIVRAPLGPGRDEVRDWMQALTPAAGRWVPVPLHVTEDRLLGGLCLATTLAEGRPVHEQGLLARADGGTLVLSMAERLKSEVVTHVTAALDTGRIEAGAAPASCALNVLALDEGIDDERPAAALRDRLAFLLDLTSLGPRELPHRAPDRDKVRRASKLLQKILLRDEMVQALCQAAAALGIHSLRPVVLAAKAARAHAALEGRKIVAEEDAAVAARLVLGPRALQMPAPPPAESDPETEDAPPPSDAPSDEAQTPPPPDAEAPAEPPDVETAPEPGRAVEDVVLDAAASGVPAGLLDRLKLGAARRDQATRGHAGAVAASSEGGRRAGVIAGQGGAGMRLNVVETLRTAAPWQPLRRREAARAGLSTDRVLVRKQDFRYTRFERRTETCVIFAVDASGSAALQRLAEAKGAVEQVLLDCYARRDHVALIAFRGEEATLLLPPTRSLARVRRSLADLAGGGTTPLAAGIHAATQLALDAERRGQAPVLVLMTDGRGNIARSGERGRPAAADDTLACAQEVRAARLPTLFVDTSPRARPAAKLLAEAMNASYLALPYANASDISVMARSLAGA
jgi:magnesium chelatase subunit D